MMVSSQWDQSEPTRCSRCKHWVAAVVTDDGESYGECRRNPPTIVTQAVKCGDQMHPIGEWPVTESEQFCGEFTPQRNLPSHSDN